jgi:hypothetical protein
MCAIISWDAHESFMHPIFVLKNGCDTPPLRQQPRLVTPRVALGPDPACGLSRLAPRRPRLVNPLALPHHLVPTSPRLSPLWPCHYRPCAPTSAHRCLWHTPAFSAVRHSQACSRLVLAGVTIRQHPHPEWVSKYSVYMCVWYNDDHVCVTDDQYTVCDESEWVCVWCAYYFFSMEK